MSTELNQSFSPEFKQIKIRTTMSLATLPSPFLTMKTLKPTAP